MVVRNSRAASPSSSMERHFFPTPSSKMKKVYGSSPRRANASPQRLSRYSSPATQRLPSVQKQSPARSRYFVTEERRDDVPSQQDSEAVCDYDTNATTLYELLESSTWERARARCRSHRDEVRTWIVRKDKNLAVRWKLLPLHAAIIFQSPNFLVSALLEQYPAAASRKDDQGMLPLHLAFRHKQEDEDLLELLLVQYPKAVMIKDKRNRVPLEHGRDSKFSAKTMRLYADAVTAASRLVGTTGKGRLSPMTPSSHFSSGTTLTAGERALIMKDHDEEIKTLKVKHENQIRKLKALTNEKINLKDEDMGKQIDLVREECEAQMHQLVETHELRLVQLHQEQKQKFHEVERAAKVAQQAAVDRHAHEVDEMQNLLTNRVAEDRDLTDSLEKEIAHLQVALQERKTESDAIALKSKKYQSENRSMRDLLGTLRQENKQIQETLSQQEEDTEANRSIREQLIKSLVRQEEGTKTDLLAQLAENMKRKIDHVLETKPASETETKPFTAARSYVDLQPANHLMNRVNSDRRDDRRESRLERDRGVSTRMSQGGLGRLERARGEGANEITDTMPGKGSGFRDNEIGEVRNLADEISAITDTSAY